MNSIDNVNNQVIYEFYPDFPNGFYRTVKTKNGKEIEVLQQNDLIDFMQHHCGYIAKGPYLYEYDDDYYKSIDIQRLYRDIREFTHRKVSASKMKEIANLLIADSQLINYVDPAKETLINLKNGVLNTEKLELIPHSKNFFFTYKIQQNFIENDKCPLFENLLFDLTEDITLVQIIFEFIGYVLYGGPPIQGKALCLQGPSRTGKSTVLNIIKDIIGRNNFSAVPLELLNKPFSAIGLQGKLANIISETTNDIIPANAFKTIVFGEPIQAAKKHHDEITLEPCAKFIFPSNDIPRFSEVTDAIGTRLIIIPFKKRHMGSDPHFFKKFKAEYPMIIYKALIAYHGVLERGRFTYSEKMEEAIKDYKINTDSVFEWADKFIKIDPEAKRKRPSELYEHYKTHSVNAGRQSLTLKNFRRRFEENYLSSLCLKVDKLGPKLDKNPTSFVSRYESGTFYHNLRIESESNYY